MLCNNNEKFTKVGLLAAENKFGRLPDEKGSRCDSGTIPSL